MVGKWLQIEPEVLLLSDPAKGVDVNAKEEMYNIVSEMVLQGTSVLIYASDNEELIQLCDRILVMFEGKIVADLDAEGLTDIVIILAVVIWYEIKRRPLYGHIIAVGNNEENAYSNGIKVIKVKFAAFAISSVFMAFAGIVITAQVASGDANLGAALTLPSVAAGVIGGISLQGGRGKLEGAIIGAIILGLLTNVIFCANIPSLYQELIKGFIIILALAIGVIPSIKNQKNRV